MAILVDFGGAAPHQNYDVTFRASNDAGFKKILTHVFSHPNAPFCQVIAKSEQVGFFWYTLISSTWYLLHLPWFKWSFLILAEKKKTTEKLPSSIEK